MANLPSDPTEDKDFDFWEFVNCSKCRMPFALENGSATIPFWLTECGHVICNNHLNRDQSCSQCGAQNIQLAPLQREMEPPMSEWFRSIPSALDSVAFTVKFQQEAMASQVRYHKTRHQQLRQLIERIKRDNTELKKSNEILQSQNEQFRRQMEHINRERNQFHTLNSNGKRQRFDAVNERSRTDSSPRSITTPIGPDRLTLLPGQPLPELSSHRQHEQPRQHHFSSNMQTEGQNNNEDSILGKRPLTSCSLEHLPSHRPTSGRPIEQFAYTAQTNKVFHAPQLTHLQAAPKIFQRASVRQTEQQHRDPGPSRQLQHPAPPASSSSRFKPALSLQTGSSTTRQPMIMGPPPTPQHARNANGPSITSNVVEQHQHRAVSGLSTPAQQPSLAASRRFFSSDSGSNPSAFSSHGNLMRGGSRVPATPSNQVNGNQRFHFLPDAAQRGNFG